MENLEFITDITSYAVVEKIAEGHSGDEKYKLEKDGKYYLLRIGDKKNLPERKAEYNRLQTYADKDVNTQKPVVFGTTIDKFYSIVSWVDGIPVMDMIKKDISKNHYSLGKKIGRELLKIHSLPLDGLRVNWQDVIEKKAALFLENYHHMNIEFSCSRYAEQYILKNICFMVGTIDFSGNNVGDPWYEFGGLLWALEYSDSFANGQIDGYFGIPPREFWKIFKFYVALYAFEHLMYNDGTPEDVNRHVVNAGRMMEVFGEDFALQLPRFRTKGYT